MKWILSLPALSLWLSLSACGAPAQGTSLPPKNYDTANDVANFEGQRVDDYYSSYRELLKSRADDGYAVDSCEPALADRATFADRIASAVEEGLKERQAQLSYVSSAFKLPARQEDFLPNGLLSHHFCPVTASSLKFTLKRNVPSAAVIRQADAFSSKMNELRRQAYAGDPQAILATHRLWTRFMMCLAYTESLTTADTNSSRAVAEKYDFTKPDGVLFYLDPAQKNPKSKFNIGLFQFAPDTGGNIQACVRAWNLRYPGCQQSTSTDFRGAAEMIASSRQAFNAFCGMTKITDMFAVQINTTSAANTHPENRLKNGKLIAPDARCVTPFFRSGASYNHFGPLQNSTRSNLGELMSCVMAE